MDMYNTIVDLIGGKVPGDRAVDGKNILPLLQFKDSQSPHTFMFHYCGEHLQATRYRPEKGKRHIYRPKDTGQRKVSVTRYRPEKGKHHIYRPKDTDQRKVSIISTGQKIPARER
jgi:hypothetical protein